MDGGLASANLERLVTRAEETVKRISLQHSLSEKDKQTLHTIAHKAAEIRVEAIEHCLAFEKHLLWCTYCDLRQRYPAIFEDVEQNLMYLGSASHHGKEHFINQLHQVCPECKEHLVERARNPSHYGWEKFNVWEISAIPRGLKIFSPPNKPEILEEIATRLQLSLPRKLEIIVGEPGKPDRLKIPRTSEA